MTEKSSTTRSPSYELTRCIVCGGAETTEVAGPLQIREEAERLWEFHMRRLSPRTPPERLVDRVAFSQTPPWRVVRCRGCGMVYRNPVERPEQLRAAYADTPVDRDALDALHEAQTRAYHTQARRLARLLARRGTGLEVGSYVGAFLAAARAQRWNFEGLDVNPAVNAYTRTRGFVVHDGDLESFRSVGRTFDAVAIWNTFDQLPDPRAALRASASLLRPNGVLALRVPNGGCYAHWRSHLDGASLSSRLATLILAHNNLLTFPYRFGFTPDSLTQLLRDLGFEVLKIVPDVLVPTADEWTRRWAMVEDRAFKPLTKRWTPWFEVYAIHGRKDLDPLVDAETARRTRKKR